MVKVYYRSSCGSSRRAFSWFEKYNVEVHKQQINKITRNDLMKLLQNSNEGLKDIVKRPGKNSLEVKKAINYMESLSFNEALNFLLSHTYVMPTPIIMDDNNHFIGYNEDEIRMFLPREYRRYRP